MSNDTSKSRRPRGRRVSANRRHGSHLELVTDEWAELADLVVLPSSANRQADGPRATTVRTLDRDPRSGSAPSSPA